MAKIAIVGAGFSGTLLALHLLRLSPQSVEVMLIDRNIQFGRGLAYSTGNANHLLNVPAGRMSAFHDRPRDFLDWLENECDPALPAPITEQSFVPRQLFGEYVRHLLNQELKGTANGPGRLELIHGDAIGLEPGAEGLVVKLDRDRSIAADLAVLAIGNFPPEPPPLDDPSFYDCDQYRPDPWAPDALTSLDPGSPVILIGTGLTMVDAVISLLDQGHAGPIHALSRRGLVPHRHASTARPVAAHDAFPTSLVALTHFLRRESDRALSQGGTWQPIVDELRPFTQDVWSAMSEDDRARFLRHLRPWWEIHRHRMAGAVADRIDAARNSGQLRIYTGRLLRFRRLGETVEASYRARGTQIVRTLVATRVVNCSGPGCDYARITHPLIRGLFDAGMARPDRFNLGLDVTPSCALRDRQGAISERIFAVGPVTKGAFWEMTAVPDIRRQCEFVAAHLSTLPQLSVRTPLAVDRTTPEISSTIN